MDIFSANFSRVLSGNCRFKNGKLYCVTEEDIALYHPESKSGINLVKNFFKAAPGLYEFLRVVFSPGFSCVKKLTPRAAVTKVFGLGERSHRLMVNIGSGTKRIGQGVINLDIYPFKNVDIVADVRQLPFKSESLDMVVCEAVLEHIPESGLVIKEISRVVKPGGYVYVSVPFLYPFHASPDDYHRWSQSGLKRSFPAFEGIESGMRAGPMAALQGVLMHILAIPFSLGSEFLYIFWSQVFMVLLAPLKLLDIFFSFSSKANEAAADIYFLGRKK